MRFNCLLYSLVIIALSCKGPKPASTSPATPVNTELITDINTGKTTPSELITFACSLEGTPYKYGSIDPKQGFDCSGFITYVFNHFGVLVPRMSVDFTNVHHRVGVKDARPGDLILFTGTDSTNRVVGHMGIVIANSGEALVFLHSTSGKAYSVTETPLNKYYRGRYMKTIRIFPQNDK
jgi:cell wall-associated NlpC family hydrolase